MLYKIVSIFTCMKVGLGLVPYKRDVVAKNNCVVQHTLNSQNILQVKSTLNFSLTNLEIWKWNMILQEVLNLTRFFK